MIQTQEQTQMSFEYQSILDHRFEEYDFNNPQIFATFKRFAFEVMAAGHKHFGAKAIFERMRWYFTVEARGDQFKLNNSFVSRYARKLIRECPQFSTFFETRELRS